MALTQISTGGVKNDAVTAGKIPANAVGSSEIADDAVGAAQIADDAVAQAAVADEAIDEARLQISNAGTNGQFLSKQSGNTGGLTWADANSYTHPNHSGEVTSTGDGATVIASNIVDEDNLKISNAGTNGQYLQKQSGNTGGLTWADVSSAPEITGTADGAIAAHKPVIVQSDGKIAEVSQVSAGTGSVTSFYTSGSSRPQYPQLAYDTTNDKVLCVFENLSESGNPYAVAGVVSSGSVSWGTPVALSTNFNVGSSSSIGVAFDASVGQFIAYAFGSSNQGNLYRVWITSTDTVNSTAYAMSDASMRQNSYHDLCLEGNGNGTYFFLDAGDGYKIKGVHLTYSSSSLSQGSKQEISISANGARMNQGVFRYVPDNSCYILAGKQNGEDNLWYHVITRSSSSYSIASSHQFGNNGQNSQHHMLDVAINGSDFLYAYKDGSNNLKCDAGTISGTTVSGLYNSQVQLVSSISDDVRSQYYTTASRYYVSYNTSGTVSRVLVNAPSAGTSAPTLSASSVSITSNVGHGEGLVYDPDSAKIIHAWGAYDDEGKSVMRTEQSTNVTSENFIGFATAAISDTASGTVAVTGNTTTQSSLTPGKRYYVTNTGGLSTTAAEPSVEAGVALTSTQLLIKG